MIQIEVRKGKTMAKFMVDEIGWMFGSISVTLHEFVQGSTIDGGL